MKLTPEQIESWRKALTWTVGPWALIMPESEIEKVADRYQARFGEARFEPEVKPCECDQARIGQTTHVDGRVTCNKCKRERK